MIEVAHFLKPLFVGQKSWTRAVVLRRDDVGIYFAPDSGKVSEVLVPWHSVQSVEFSMPAPLVEPAPSRTKGKSAYR